MCCTICIGASKTSLPAEVCRPALDPAGAPKLAALELTVTLNELSLGSKPLMGDAAPFHPVLAHPIPGEHWRAFSPSGGY